MTKEDLLSFLDDEKRVIQWIADNIENSENAVILITWLGKMTEQLRTNISQLEQLKKVVSKDSNNTVGENENE